MLETSFCGSKPTLADNLIEPSKPETDDLEKILLKREADTTKALIPESIKVSMVGGNLKPDPLDKPRRRGREERKEIFKREVEITKRFLEKVNIEVGLRLSFTLYTFFSVSLKIISKCTFPAHGAPNEERNKKKIRISLHVETGTHHQEI